MKRPSHGPVAGGLALALLATSSEAVAEGGCAESEGLTVGLTAGLGLVAGAAGALISSAVVATADDTRDYSFGVGAGAGIGVTAGLSAIYFGFDLGTGCSMVRESGGVAWSVPIVTVLVGSALPVAIWGGSEENDGTATDQAALATTPASRGTQSPGLSLAWHF